MKIEYTNIGICGLSCFLCPRYQTDAASRCHGCKTESRMSAGCPFITCAVKKRGIEFCWDCNECNTCSKWQDHRDQGKMRDTFKCYQSLEHDIEYILKHGVHAFVQYQNIRELLLKQMLEQFNEGRSRSYYCIAVTVMDISDIERALDEARQQSHGLDVKSRSKLLHHILDRIAAEKGYLLSLRK